MKPKYASRITATRVDCLLQGVDYTLVTSAVSGNDQAVSAARLNKSMADLSILRA